MAKSFGGFRVKGGFWFRAWGFRLGFLGGLCVAGVLFESRGLRDRGNPKHQTAQTQRHREHCEWA